MEMVGSLDELKSSRSVAGKSFPKFEMLDAKIASALNKIIPNSHFKKKVSLEEQKAQKEDRFLRGRLESLYKLRIRESGQLKTVLELRDMEIHQKMSMPNYQKLTIVKRSLDQKLRLRKIDARNEKIETGAVVTSRRGSSGIERGKGVCYQWKAKGQCSRGDQCSFRLDSDERAKSSAKTTPSFEPPVQKHLERYLH